MGYRVAFNFEDGVTRFVDCKAGEKVLDAAYRNKINLPMDCSDGVCGTCKCQAESGIYSLGNDYIEDALSEDEAAEGFVLTCQMMPASDCIIRVPATSTSCKTGQQTFQATVARIEKHQDAAIVLELEFAPDSNQAIPMFMPGQYVNINVPDSDIKRSYSFSSAPGESRACFLVKMVPGGMMSSWLAQAKTGDKLDITGPMGSFYLRKYDRPLLFLAGGTGLAPFLSMLEVLARENSQQKIHLVYGVTRDLDLVLVDALEDYVKRLPKFSFTTVVAEEASNHPRKGWVTQHMPEEMLADGEVDIYLCGPPPMVDAVRRYLLENAISPRSFHYEKFTPNASSGTSA
ncbi:MULTISPECIES: benzoate 1,2-dioxygenase electron transfer component BenC [Bartonella]|uniref:benzoate 1,2-dioxygenase electron transfer component BenC n=1 Tax=Bartonella TaxID=773 RepID=UPI0018DCCAB1|nr:MULTISPECIES: benzoate 1,2-dioxygenase electron transfer component BenC [Bartonella]MBH9975599.1 ring-hydroxylating dioxygenase ferredoxin reductase family protein [Bartonella choladocola]MBI0015206.1 ring-hydroxylating dioxygenase ferredoxin reductase family protein [Bartonella sp. B10834G3]